MNRFARLNVVFLFLVFAAKSLPAQERTLTIEESIALGLENSKILHSSLMKAEYADAKSGEAAALLYPSLKFQAAYQQLSDVPEFKIPLPGAAISFPVILNNYNLKATLQQPLFTGWKLQGAANSAEYNAEASRKDFSKDKAELVYNIKSAYWNLYRAKEFKHVADDNVNQISAHLNDVENLSKQGMATNNEVLKVKVQFSNAKILQSDAENNVQIAMIALNSIIGIPLTTEIKTSSSLTPTSKDYPQVEKLLATAFTQRPDIQGMEWRVKASDAGVTAAKGGWLPQIFLTGNYYYSRPNQRVFPAKDEFKDTWDIGVSLQFDIWNNLTTLHQTTAAKAQYEQTKDALAVLRDGITLEVTQSYLNFKQMKQKIELSRLGVEQASENYRVTSEKFKSGLTTNSELLDAEVALLQSKLQLTQALVDYELAQAKLEKAIGENK